MVKNVLDWLEKSVNENVSKIAFESLDGSITFGQLYDNARSIGSYLAKREALQLPVAVFSGRNCNTPALFLGVVYSGRAYAPIDSKLPDQRILRILKTLDTDTIVTDRENYENVRHLLDVYQESIGEDRASACIYIAEEMLSEEPDTELLCKVRNTMSMTDPLYVLFTSGSTGNPKGIITSHLALMTYIEAYSKVMDISEDDILGNQSPLDYIAAVRDIYLPLLCGCSTYIIPKEYFMEPDNMFDCMNNHGVTAIGWSVSAFTILSSLGAFRDKTLNTLKKVCFSGSVMPGRCLKVWQEHLPQVKFVNQYGPTEATASCTYYEVDHVASEDEVLPIGVPYDNYHVFILNDDMTEADAGQEGEICVSGPILALGYYNDPVRTAESFIQNPLNGRYLERIYRTGDIGLRRKDGLFEFHGRKDRQIKHMGHRVELDEIEKAAGAIEGVSSSCCMYNKEKEMIWLFYCGEAGKKDIAIGLRKVIPGFMVPRKVVQLDKLPALPNGKTDMGALRLMMM